MEEYRPWVVDRNVIKMRANLEKEESLTPEIKKILGNNIHQTMNTLHPYRGKKLKLQTIVQRQIYRFCANMIKGVPFKGFHFKW